MAKDPLPPPPWYWHLYRPEALLGYIAIAFFIYWLVDGQPGTRTAVRTFPLPDGSAVALGHEVESPDELVIWRTEDPDRIAWQQPLPDNFIRPASPDQFRPVMASDGQFLYVLTGLQRPGYQQLLSLHQVRLSDGEITWTNTTQPSGIADFEAVFWIGESLITIHRVQGETRKLYVTGRSPVDGEMRWNQRFDWEPAAFRRATEDRAAVLPLPVAIGVRQADTLHVIDPGSGNTFAQLPGQGHSFHGGWIWYQRKNQWRGYDLSRKTDIKVLSLGDSTAPAPDFQVGFANGFPVRFGSERGWISMAGDSVRSSNSQVGPARLRALRQSTYPANHSHFLAESWTRYLPVVAPETPARLYWWDLNRLDTAYQSPPLADGSFSQSVFLSYDRYHYWLFGDAENRTIVLQFSGADGTLQRAVRIALPEENRLPIRWDQPIGGRIWLGGGTTLVGLDAFRLDMVYGSGSGVKVESVLKEYAEWLGYTLGDQ